MSQENLDLTSSLASGPVECLGQTFPTDEKRREHYTELLREKLKDPEFRKIEGFPIGEDEDILNLSDPPYYTACPNPWIAEFIEHHVRPYDPKEKYHREPFASDVSEGKKHPIYNAHSYHTKVPHRAIMHYILHYTEPGDIVFDGFCGTGMTGLAAQLCGDAKEVRELGYSLDSDGSIRNKEGEIFSKLGTRRAMLNDLSPIATFIANNYNSPVSGDTFESGAKAILAELNDNIGWMYETTHTDGQRGKINFVIWSDVFVCPECGAEIIFWDQAVDKSHATVHSNFPCQQCSCEVSKRTASRAWETTFDTKLNRTSQQRKQVPVSINYSFNKKRYNKLPDSFDLQLIDRIKNENLELWHPSNKFLFQDGKWGDTWRSGIHGGLTNIHHFYTSRNLQALSHCYELIRRTRYKFLFTGFVGGASKLNQLHLRNYVFGGGGCNPGTRKGTLYVPSISLEVPITSLFKDRLATQSRAFRSVNFAANENAIISTASCAHKPSERDCNSSLDYIFIDPPFGSNLHYSELSHFWESWLSVFTNNGPEAIENESQQKGALEYRKLMLACFTRAYELLKPGRWMTIEFSNTKASVWNNIQAALSEAGFIVASVSALDKKQGGINANVTKTAVKQDLAINAYKPDSQLELNFAKHGNTTKGVWAFINTHLSYLAVTRQRGGQLEFISERDPRILYDRMVAFYVAHNTPVPLSSAEFRAELTEKFPERDGMVFLHEQVAEYDKKSTQMENLGQMSIFVEDEKSAINWLRNLLKSKPSTSQDIHPDFMQQLTASWKKFESRPELNSLLEQNFLKYDGTGEVPSQIHGYLSTNFKNLRGKEKDDSSLKAKAKDRWYVPDPKKAVDVEKLRDLRLLKEFWSYLPAGYTPPRSADGKQIIIPGLEDKPKTIGKAKKLKEVRTEAVRVGFAHCFKQQDYATILAVAEQLPANVVEEDEQLQMIYDVAEMRSE